MATAAKAKLLLRELKTLKADLAFAKQRCSQLEEENKMIRESREKGSNVEDDDLIRLQLETLLAEKARLAHENSVYARENRFLREIVEYHQLTMQDVVYLDEGSEEVTEVYPFTKMLSVSPPSPSSPADTTLSSLLEKEIYPVPDLPQETQEVSESDVPQNAGIPALKEEEEEDAGSDAPQSAGGPALKEVEDTGSDAPPSAGVPALKEVEDAGSDASPGDGIPVLEEKEEEEEEEEEVEECTSKSAVHGEEKARTPSASYGVNK